MDWREAEYIELIAALTQASIAECRGALKAAGFDLFRAAQSLMSETQIREAYQSLRVRQTGGPSIKNPPTAAETQIIERLYRNLENPEPPVPPSEFAPPPQLPRGTSSYARLVRQVVRLSPHRDDQDGSACELLVERVMQLGFSRNDAEYIIASISGGYFRAMIDGRRTKRNCPSREQDPIAHAAYRMAMPKRWWQFWRWLQ